MGLLPIRLYPEEVLRQECRPVETFDEKLAKLIGDMVAKIVIYRASI